MMLSSFCWLLLVTQPSSPVHDAPKVSWSDELGLASLDAIGAALSDPLENQNEWEVTLEDGSKRQVKTCRDFLAVIRTKFDVSSEYDWSTLFSTGARCFALETLTSATAPSQSFLNWFTFSPAAIAKLPPGLDMLDAPESVEAARKAEKACKPWGTYDRTLKVHVETAARARLRTSAWSGRLVLYARGDFNGDGVEDLLLRRDAHVDDGGTAADTSVFIITQTSAKRCPRVIRDMGAPH
jgi:hypothetical protein